MSDLSKTSDVLKRIGDLKTQAKNRRDLKRYDRAVHLLEDAIEIARTEYDEATNLPDWRATLASELADCWGILGGIERRWAEASNIAAERAEHLRKSVHAYDQGFGYEFGSQHLQPP